MIFHPTPSRWREDIRQEACREAQYIANRHRKQVDVYYRRNPDVRKDRYYFRFPGQTPPVFAHLTTYLRPDRKFANEV